MTLLSHLAPKESCQHSDLTTEETNPEGFKTKWKLSKEISAELVTASSDSKTKELLKEKTNDKPKILGVFPRLIHNHCLFQIQLSFHSEKTPKIGI